MKMHIRFLVHISFSLLVPLFSFSAIIKDLKPDEVNKYKKQFIEHFFTECSRFDKEKNISLEENKEQYRSGLEKELQLASDAESDVTCAKVMYGIYENFATYNLNKSTKVLYLRTFVKHPCLLYRQVLPSFFKNIIAQKEPSEINITLRKKKKTTPHLLHTLGFVLKQEKMPTDREHLGVNKETRTCYIKKN